MLEDGEISDSSVDLPTSTTHPKYEPLPQRQANGKPNGKPNGQLNGQLNGQHNGQHNGRPSKRSASITKDPEESLLEMFTMDVEPDSASMNGVQTAVPPKKRKPFTGWTEQLLEEKQGNPSKPGKRVVIVDPKQEFEAAKLQHHRKGAAVFINHRLLEKRQLGEFEKRSPPKGDHKSPRDHNDVMDKLAKNIAASLKEKRQDVVRKVVDACGVQKATELCTEAQLIHSTVGMLTIDGKPRTLGGCFFQLVKSKGDLNEQQKKEIFYEANTQLSLRKKQARNVKKKMKKQLKTKNQLEKLFEQMNLDIAVRIA